jgi:hypothetical protein
MPGRGPREGSLRGGSVCFETLGLELLQLGSSQL